MRRNAVLRSSAIAAMLGSAALLATTRAASAQTAGVAPVILTLPGSTSAVATGGAYLLQSIQSDAVFYNPALARGAGSLILSHERYGGAASLTTFSMGTSVDLTFGLKVLDYGVSGCCFEPSELQLGFDSNQRAGEVEGVVGYARTIHGLRLGGAAKWVQQWNSGDGDGTAAFDVGFTMSPIDDLTLGLAVQNIGDGQPAPTLNGGPPASAVDYALPRREQITISTSSQVLGPLDFEATGEVHATREEDIAGGLGVELSYWPFRGLAFMARGGARIGNKAMILPGGTEELKHGIPTAGAGIQYKHFTFEYAWEPFSGTSDAHRFGVRIN